MKKRFFARKKAAAKEIALENIKNLIRLSSNIFKKDKNLADRYVELATKTSKKYQVTVPSEYKRLYCRHCNKALKPGENLSIRTSRKKRVVYYCKECRKYMRFPYVKEKKV